MEKALIAQNRHWNNEKYPNLFGRDLITTITKKIQAKEKLMLFSAREEAENQPSFKLLINYLLEKTYPTSILNVNLNAQFILKIW